MQERYADLEIRILERTDRGYPVELTLDGRREFERGYLAPHVLPWAPSASRPATTSAATVATGCTAC